jgi:hypothetical protein
MNNTPLGLNKLFFLILVFLSLLNQNISNLSKKGGVFALIDVSHTKGFS